jgi:yecA family protein
MPEFDDLADVFWRLGAMQSPSELHGYITGQLTVGQKISSEQWLADAASYIDSVEPPAGEDNQCLMALYNATETDLARDDLAFQLLLPDDSNELSQRLDSLRQWCQGFLTGFALAGKQIQKDDGKRQYSSDVSEALSDMAAISQVGVEDDETDGEQNENNFFELSEYLRIAVINIYLECKQLDSDAGNTAKSSTTTSPENKLH